MIFNELGAAMRREEAAPRKANTREEPRAPRRKETWKVQDRPTAARAKRGKPKRRRGRGREGTRPNAARPGTRTENHTTAPRETTEREREGRDAPPPKQPQAQARRREPRGHHTILEESKIIFPYGKERAGNGLTTPAVLRRYARLQRSRQPKTEREIL